MKKAGTNKRTADGAALKWRTYTGKRITVRAPEGSYAAKQAAGELRDAERAAEALEKPPDPPDKAKRERLDIYLSDPVADLAGGGTLDGASDHARVTPAGAVVRVIARAIERSATG